MGLFLASADETAMRATERSGRRYERKRDPYVGAAVAPVGCVGLTVVRPCDRSDDREPEPGSGAYACVVGATEPVERFLEEIRGDACALVADVKLERAIGRGGAQGDLSLPVAQGVVDEVAERLLDPQAVERCDERRARANRYLARR